MDFPLFHLDFMGNRMLIAIIAIIHVIINHGLAVGFVPLVTFLEFRGYQKGKQSKEIGRAWDENAKKLMFTGFIITTTVGALTGVGIWFAAALANPASIGSLIRIFYFAWFAEWVIFLLEVVFIMYYYLTWKKSNTSLKKKKRHILLGVYLSVFSWLTMAIIVAILGFMMDPGSWLENKTLFSGFANPIYFPQLIFRTPVAMMMGGCFALMLTMYILKKNNPEKPKIIRFISLWIIQWTPIAALGAFIYYWFIPRLMIGNMPVAIGTQAFQTWYSSLVWVIAGTVGIGLLVSTFGLTAPRKLPKHLMVVPLLASFLFLGTFERLREFIRKPYVIGEYMYANGILVEEYPLFQQEGILKHSSFSEITEITEKNKLQAGQDVFYLSCTRCHTTHGINSIVTNFEIMYGKDKPLDLEQMKTYIKGMHNVRTYMPPFPGNEKELDALSAFIQNQQKYPEVLEGPQTGGIKIKTIINKNN